MAGTSRDFGFDNEEDNLFLGEVNMGIDSIEPSTTGNKQAHAAPITKRNFPGPAGLLPTLRQSDFPLLDKPVKSNSLSNRIKQILSNAPKATLGLPLQSSQDYEWLLEGRCWPELWKMLGLFENPTLEKMDISWIRRRVRKSLPIKIPFLAAILEKAPEIVKSRKGVSSPSCVTLVDSSGSISATLEASFVAKYASLLNPGTCLALQNFGVLFLGQLRLNVTTKNVTFITSELISKNDDEEEVDYGVQTATVSEFFPDKIIENYKMFDSLLAKVRSDDDDCQTYNRSGGISDTLFSTPLTPKDDNEHLSKPCPSRLVAKEDAFFDNDEEEFLKAIGESF